MHAIRQCGTRGARSLLPRALPAAAPHLATQHTHIVYPALPGLASAGPMQTRLRKAIYTAIRAFQARHDLREVRDMIDIGCSVGVSTRWLAAEWPQAQVGAGGRGSRARAVCWPLAAPMLRRFSAPVRHPPVSRLPCQVTGLDLSPHFLAVAELRERQLAGGAG